MSGLGFAGCGDKEREWGPTWAGLVGPEASWAVAQRGGVLSLLYSFSFCFLFPFLLFIPFGFIKLLIYFNFEECENNT